MSYETANYHAQGATEWVVGGTLTLDGTLDSTGTITNAGTLDNQGTISSSGDITVTGTVTFESGGQISDTGKWDDFRVPLTAIRLGAAKIPGWSTMFAGFQGYGFDAAAEEQVHLYVQLPHEWKTGSELRPHVHWCTTAATTENVVWGIEYSMAQSGSTFPEATTQYVAGNSSGAFLHTLDSFPAITTTGVTSASAMMLVRLFRLATDSSDTYAADAHLLEFDIHYQKSRLGTTGEFA